MDLEKKYKKEEKQFRGWNNREKFKEELERQDYEKLNNCLD